jgi:hypothetical protein
VGHAGAPGRLTAAATIEVPVERGPRRRTLDADEEILNTCDELRQMAASEVTLVTSDATRRLLGEARSIPVKRMPEKYQRKVSDAGMEPQT